MVNYRRRPKKHRFLTLIRHGLDVIYLYTPQLPHRQRIAVERPPEMLDRYRASVPHERVVVVDLWGGVRNGRTRADFASRA
jgi:hypothetical protein